MLKNYNAFGLDTNVLLNNETSMPLETNKKGFRVNWLSQLIILFCVLFMGFSVNAQNPLPYTFSQSTGTYVPLTGGTSYQSGATLGTNAVSGQITIPFTFKYNGVDYTSLIISNNGFVTFGTTAPTAATYTPISSTTAYGGAISGYGFNLVNSPVSGTAPNISYGADGSDFVIQFTDLGRTGITGDRMSFQIRLTQTTNVIKIVYNNWAASSTTTAVANFGQVGLRGAANTAFLNRMVYPTAPYNTWATSGGGADNGNTPLQAINTFGPAGPNCMRYNNAYLPANGLTYTYTPVTSGFYQTLPYNQNFESWSSLQSVNDVPGTGVIINPASGNQSVRAHNETLANSVWGSPSGGNIAVPGASQGTKCARFNCFNVGSGLRGYMDFFVNFNTPGTKSMTLDLINVTSAKPVRVYLSTDGGITFSAALATYNTTISTWTKVASISLGSSTSSTCVVRIEMQSDYGSGNPDVGVDNVDIISTVLAGCSTPSALASNLVFSAVTTTSLSGSFTAASPVPSKYLVVRSESATPPAPSNGTVYAIGNTTLGAGTNVRLAANSTSFTDSALTPGTQYYYHVFSYNDNCTGEPFYSATAYTLGQATICAAATGMGNNTVTNNAANITWTGSGNYIVEYGPSGFTPGLGATAGVNGTIASSNATSPFALTGLSGNTGYVVYVRQVCSLGGYYSANSSATTFTTLCDAIATFPSTESFATYLPSVCWTEGDLGNLTAGPTTISSTASSWEADGFLNSGGTGAAKINIDAAADNDWIISPYYTIPASGYIVKYNVGVTQWNGTVAPTTPWEADDFVELLVSTGNTNWTVLKTYNSSNVPSHLGQLDEVDLSSYAGQTVHFAFRGVEGATNGGADIDFFIDNFSILLSVGCSTPSALASNLVFSAVTTSSLSGSFTAAVPAPSKYLVVRSTSATPPIPSNGTFYAIGNTTLGAGTNVRLAANSTSFTDSGLTAGIQYYYHIFSYNDTCTGEPFYSTAAYTLGQATVCSAATAMGNNTVTNNAANITWTGSGNYIVEYGPIGFTPGTGATAGVNGTIASSVATSPFALTGLTAATGYAVYVRQVCSLGGYYSANSSVTTFTTLCDAIATFPSTESFATYLPSVCWTEGDLGNLTTGPATISNTASSWEADGFLNSGSTGAAKINIFSSSDSDWIISPYYTISSGFIVKYSVGANEWDTSNAPVIPWEADDFVELLVSTGNTNWTVLKTYNSSNVPSHLGQIDEINLSSYNGQTIHFAFRAVEGASDGSADIDFFIDNFTVEQLPPCETALGGTVSGSNQYCVSGTPTITCSGYSTGDGSTYQWYSSTNVGDYPNAGSAVNLQTNPAALTTGLVSTTTYYWLRVTCATNSSTDNSNMVTITVNPLPATTIVTGAGTFCSNATITASNGNDGTMYFQGTTSGGTSTAVVSASEVITTSGTYYFRARSAAGCWGPQGSVAVVIDTPVSISVTPANVCQGGSGSLSATALDCNASGTMSASGSGGQSNGVGYGGGIPITVTVPTLPVGAVVTSTTTTISYTANSPSWLSDLEIRVLPPTAVGAQVSNLSASSTGSSGAVSNVPFGSWSTGNPVGNWVFSFAETVNDSSVNPDANITNITVTVNYTLPTTINWYTSSVDGFLIGTGSPFNPVGVANSGLADTNTPGTTIYYAACSASSTCRTPVNFVINPSTTPTLTFENDQPSEFCAGTNVTFTATANNLNGGTATYVFEVDGETVTNTTANTYTSNTLQDGQEVTVDVTITPAVGTCLSTTTLNGAINVTVNDNYIISASAGSNGSISPSGDTTLTCLGTGSQTYDITPNSGYLISNVVVDDVSNTPLTSGSYATGGTYVFNNVNANHTINVTFALACINSVAPTSISGTTTICNGSSTILTLQGGTLGTNAVAQWFTSSCGGTLVDTGNSITVSPTSDTTYFVRYSGDCNTTSCASTTVTVGTQPQWYLDADGDGYYTGSAVSSCTSPGAGYTTTVLGGGDCNDDPSAVNPLGVPSSAIHPNATEVCYNNIDDDCDGFFSESCPAVVVNMTPATTITNFSIALSAVPYTYPGASSLGYRFWIRNLTSGQIREVNMPTRFVTIPSDIRSYNTLYELRAAAIINGEIVPYAGNTITVISPSIQLVQLSATSCNSTLASIGSTISASPGPNALTYTFRIRLASDNSPTPTYGEVTTLGSRFVNSNSFIGMPLQYNTVYSVSVKYTFDNNDGLGVQESGWGAECTLTTPGIPVIGLSSPMCGSTLSSMNSTISANPALYAIQYRFRMRLSSSNPSLPESYSTSLPVNSRFTYMSALQQQFPLEYAKSYYVSVQYSITNNSVEQWSNYGPECLLSTPALPFATIVGDCETGLTPASSSELIYSTTYAGASGYRFILQRYNEESELIYDQYEDRVTNNFSLSMFSGLESGQTYYLSVWVIMNGQPVDGGINPCEIDIPVSGKAVIASPFSAKAYPNPFANNFLVDVTTESKSAVNIKVYDMVGRLVEEQSVQVTDMKTSPIGNQFPSGVYNVIITQDNEVQTLRVVKR